MARDHKSRTYRVRELPPDIDKAGVIQLLQQRFQTEDISLVVCVHSLARSLTVLDARRTKTATVTIFPLPESLKSNGEWSFETHYGNSEYDVVIDRNFLDFTVLSEVDDDAHTLDCIAISGLGSHPFGSWQHRGTGSTFMWLRDGLPKDIPGCRTIIYGYDSPVAMSSSFQDTNDLATRFVNRLNALGFGSAHSKPIIFLAHSLGGIILKESLIMLAGSSDRRSSISGKLRSMICFGVPHKGMATSQLMMMVKGNPNEKLIEALSPGSAYLRQSEVRFNGIQSLKGFDVISFYETKTTKTVASSTGEWGRSGPEVVLVERDSAIQRCSQNPGDVYAIDEDHSAMVKFARHDPNYECVLDCIRRTFVSTKESEPEEVKRHLSLPSERLEIQDTTPHTKGFPDYEQLQFELYKPYSHEEIVQSLRLDILDYRLTDISPQFDSTCEWVFQESSVEMTTWLLKGQGVYWIHGKPGSGKSTLMKYVYQHQTTSELLRNWQRPGKLILAGFFFYYRGSEIQKSFEGLVRSVLFQVLDRAPDLCREIPDHCIPENRTKKFKWTMEKLQAALHAVLRQRQTNLDICLCIDALDEFDGHLELISDFIEGLVRREPESKTRTKVLFSSRPKDIIQNHFGHLPNFQIQQYTKADIERYTTGRLEQCQGLVESMQSSWEMRESVNQTVKDITQKAEGVFLWVRLALDNISEALEKSDGSVKPDIASILRGLPSELDDFYRTIIDRIPQSFRWDAYLALEILLRHKYEPTVGEIYWIIECARCQTLSGCAERMCRDGDSLGFCRKLRDRCGGLVEFDEELQEDGRLRLMHETVREFVGRPTFQQSIVGQAALFRAQNGYTELAKYNLTSLKYFPSSNVFPLKLCIKYCNLAEATTGVCQRALIDELEPEDLLHHNCRVFTYPDAGVSFAIVSDLFLYMQSKTEHTPRKWGGEDSILDLLVTVVHEYHRFEPYLLVKPPPAGSPTPPPLGPTRSEKTEVANRTTRQLLWPEVRDFKPNHTRMVKLLLEKTAGKGGALLINGAFRKLFLLAIKDQSSGAANRLEVDEVVEIVRTFLEHGQDPNMVIQGCSHKTARRTQDDFCVRATHLSDGRMLDLLLSFGADINGKDGKSRTPLDAMILRVVTPRSQIVPWNETKALGRSCDILIQNGGFITRAGARYLDECIMLLQESQFDTHNFQNLVQRSKESGFLSPWDMWVTSLRRRFVRVIRLKIL